MAVPNGNNGPQAHLVWEAENRANLNSEERNTRLIIVAKETELTAARHSKYTLLNCRRDLLAAKVKWLQDEIASLNKRQQIVHHFELELENVKKKLEKAEAAVAAGREKYRRVNEDGLTHLHKLQVELDKAKERISLVFKEIAIESYQFVRNFHKKNNVEAHDYVMMTWAMGIHRKTIMLNLNSDLYNNAMNLMLDVFNNAQAPPS